MFIFKCLINHKNSFAIKQKLNFFKLSALVDFEKFHLNDNASISLVAVPDLCIGEEKALVSLITVTVYAIKAQQIVHYIIIVSISARVILCM